MRTLFLAHSKQDQPAACELAEFLQRGADVEVYLKEGEIGPGETLLSKAQEGLMADAMLVMLSPDSVPERWVREEWTSAFWDQPQAAGVLSATVLCRACRFPDLLSRKNFFDLTEDRLDAFRRIKQWLSRLGRAIEEPAFVPARTPEFAGQEAELEALRRALGDAPGCVLLTGDCAAAGKTTLALEFARRCQGEFELLCWLGCGRRSLAALAGDLSAQLGLRLPGHLEENLEALRRFCAPRRLLIVLDDVQDEAATQLIGRGWPSVLITSRRGELAELFSATLLGLRGTPQGYSPSSLLEMVTALPDRERRLLTAMAACAPGGFGLAVSARMAGLEERSARETLEGLLSRSLVRELNQNGPRYLVPGLVRDAVEPAPHDHARAVFRHFAGWISSPQDYALDLPDLEHSLRFTLTASDDEEAWSLACHLARLGCAVTTHHDRLAEAHEFMESLANVADRKADRRVLADCTREQVWILQRWGRTGKVRQLGVEREALCGDQMCFDF
jgi:hypothetical protein